MIFPANNEITATPTFCRAWKIEVSSLILTDLGIYLGQSQSQNILYLHFHPWRLYLSKNLSPTIITNLFFPRQLFWEVVPELSVFYNNKVCLMSRERCIFKSSIIKTWINRYCYTVYKQDLMVTIWSLLIFFLRHLEICSWSWVHHWLPLFPVSCFHNLHISR